MTYLTKLYVHVKKGSALEIESLCTEDCAERVDRVYLANGDSVGVVMATSATARKKMEAVSGITVLPPLHRPIGVTSAATFAFAGALAADTTNDVANKLQAVLSMPWLDPENG